MTDAYHIETLTIRYERILEMIEILNFDLLGLVELLDANIEAEEQSSGIFDPSDSDYPSTARRHRMRRDNLIAVISRAQQADVLH
jgi:hypothetical protein